MAYEKYIVKDFMAAWFDKDYSVISKEDFDIVYAEYQDTSGLFISEDFEKRGYINHLSQRINYVKLFIRLQRDFMRDFDKPFLRSDEILSLKGEYGYNLKWNDDLQDFEEQLKKIESREIKYTSTLEAKIKELNDSRKAIEKKVKVEEDDESLRKSRLSFIRMLNSLGKIGFKVDKMTTTVEELALMIKQQLEEAEEQQMR